jgi:hypothetical protein
MMVGNFIDNAQGLQIFNLTLGKDALPPHLMHRNLQGIQAKQKRHAAGVVGLAFVGVGGVYGFV